MTDTHFTKSGASPPDSEGMLDTARPAGSSPVLTVPPRVRRSVSHNSVAKSERERKEKYPEKFCRSPKCLYRTDAEYCAKHRPAVLHTHSGDGLLLPAPMTSAEATKLGIKLYE